MDQVIWPQLCRQNGISREQLGAIDRKQIEDPIRYTLCRRLKELVNERLAKTPGKVERNEWAGVSETLPIPAGIRFSENKQINGYVDLSAENLFQVMLPFLNPDPASAPFSVGESINACTFAKLIEITMERAGMVPEDLDMLILHGGSCRSPFIPWGFKRLKETGVLASTCKIISTPDLITSVSRGAALFGSLSKKFCAPYIRPIIPEEMCIQTVGNEYVYLAHAGEELPYKKAFDKHFYLFSAGQREIVVPIYIGYDAERRRLASTLTIPIANNLPKSHLIEVELQIGTDKDSRWRFRPKGYQWSDAYEVANPWIGREPNEDVTKLLETRQKIRSLIDAGTQPSIEILTDEAHQAARAGYPEEGLALAEDILVSSPNSLGGWAVKAVIHQQRGELQQAIESYQKASSIEPDDMVVRANYGRTLLEAKQYENAIDVMREALASDPSLAYLHVFLAEAYQALDNSKEMNKELKQFFIHARQETVRRPDDVSAWKLLHWAAIRIGRYTDAEGASEQIAELNRVEGLLAGPEHGE